MVICSLAGLWLTRVLVIQAISIPGSGLVASLSASSVRVRLASAERDLCIRSMSVSSIP